MGNQHVQKMLTITPQQSKLIDQIACRDFAIPSLLLMENASLNAANWLWDRFANRSLLIVCGTGNNGGDGLAIARHWSVRGGQVRGLLVGSVAQLSVDAATQWQMVCALRLPLANYNPASGDTSDRLSMDDPEGQSRFTTESLTAENWSRWCGNLAQTIVIDALLGTGARGALRHPLPSIIEYLNQHAPHKIAIDIPSGLDGISGQPTPIAIQAQQTLTFVAPKTGFSQPGAAVWLGQVTVIDIGVPQAAIQRAMQC